MACGFPGTLGVEARGLEPFGTPSGPRPPALCSFSPSGLSRAGARSTSKPAAGRSHVWPPCAVSPLAGLSRAGAPAAPPCGLHPCRPLSGCSSGSSSCVSFRCCAAVILERTPLTCCVSASLPRGAHHPLPWPYCSPRCFLASGL